MRRPALLSLAVAVSACIAHAGPAWTDAEKAAKEHPGFELQGEYVGTMKHQDGEAKVGLHVIALGNGKFRAVGYPGGLPGDGWNQEEKITAEGVAKDGVVVFSGDEGTARLAKGTITIYPPESDEAVGTLKKVHRESPTLGAMPPKGAVVLYAGPDDVENWKGGKADEAGHLQQGVTSNETFGDHTLHVEFLIPYQPEDKGQGRGNSGLYVQGRYEVQMLDSFGLEGKHNECGGSYSVKDPDVNMAFPPLSWQTYDVEYTAAKFEGDKMVSAPRVTVKHNGVVVHKDVELPGNRSTTAAPSKPGPEPGPVYLQNHGNPVRYRNIWAVRK